MTTYSIPDCNLSGLRSAVERLNRRCKRLGCPEITMTAVPDHVRHAVRQLTVNGEMNLCWRKDISKIDPSTLPSTAFLANAWEPTGEVMQWWSVSVEGGKPSLNGYSFVAVLEPLETDSGSVENLVRGLPGEECPAEFRTRVGECDHCRTNRRRSQTFVVRGADGSHKCVGRQCLKDFLGYHADPSALAGEAELLAELGSLCGSAEEYEEGFGGGRRERAWETLHFLTMTACRIRSFGWVSRASARDSFGGLKATADVVMELLSPPAGGRDAKEQHEKLCAEHIVTDADRETATAALEWAASIPESDRNDYLANVNLVARMGTISGKTAGVGASIIIAHVKHCEREVERQRLATRPPSQHVGTVGQRIPFIRVTCNRLIMRETAFGVTGIHGMADDAGNDLTWFASGGAVIREGETAWVAASVKEHGEFRGRKQTIVTRVTVLTDEFVSGLMEKEAKKAARAAKKAAK